MSDFNKVKTDQPQDRMMQFFNEYGDQLDRKFHELAQWIITNLPSNPERTVALRKLLEAKDCDNRTIEIS